MVAAARDDAGAKMLAGVTGPVERVLVVGAGIAGLSAANALANAGVECVVLEARDRIGGRLHTVDLDGTLVDVGGSWIHHPVGNPVRVFAAEAGIACHDADPLPLLSGFDWTEGRQLTRTEVEAELTLLYEDFPYAVEQLRVDLGPDASVAMAIDAFLMRTALEPARARRAQQGLRAVIEAEAADLSERQSLRWMWNEVEYGGNYFGDMPVGGYRSIVDALATGVDIRLGVEVSEVVCSADVVQVRCADGTTFEGSHVVVTVPLGVLKRGALQFSPKLPADRLDAIQRLGFGRLEKVALRFDEPFWREAGLSHLMLFPQDHDEATLWVFDLDDFGAGPALVWLAFHGSAWRVLDSSPEEAARWLLDLLGRALGRPCPAPTAIAVTSWAYDPYAGGAYTHIPPGAGPADIDLLGEPLAGRLLFAGEHTQSARLAYADGALTSGIREAKRLLGRATVRLAPIAPIAPTSR